ncbi:hypothetical protein ACFUJR_32025 [Streptomyces sp. NPDC057271]|uniref:hypothetical protein n=1 Tax=unclassified Streptomyces TaxID=2593676 RepID=UPI003638D230
MERKKRSIIRRGAVAAAALSALLAAVLPSGAHADNVPVADRKYVFELEKIHCVAQTNDDSPSDEMYVKTTLPSSPLSYDTMFTATAGSFDTGDTLFVDEYHRAITPKYVHSDSYRDDILFGSHDAWSINRAGTSPTTIKVELWEEDGGKQLGGDDDLVNSYTYKFSSEGLALDLPDNGDSISYPLDFIGFGGHYVVTLAVHRVA